MNIWETINIFWVTLACNLFVKTVFIAVMLDTVLGLLRAIKEKKFNSCFGIDGAIRKNRNDYIGRIFGSIGQADRL